MSPNGLYADCGCWPKLLGTAGFIKLSKLTSDEFSPKNDCGVFACGFFVDNGSRSSNREAVKNNKKKFHWIEDRIRYPIDSLTIVVVRTIQWGGFRSICYDVKFIKIRIGRRLCSDWWWSCLFLLHNLNFKFELNSKSFSIFTPIVGAHGSAGFCSKLFEFNCHGSPSGCDLLSHGSTTAGWGFDNHGSTGSTFIFVLPFVAAAPFWCHESFDDGVADWFRDSQPSTFDMDVDFGVGSAHGSIGGGGEAVFDHGSAFGWNYRKKIIFASATVKPIRKKN